MTSRRKRKRKQGTQAGDVIKLLASFFWVIVAAILVVYVFLQIKNDAFSFFAWKKTALPEQTETETETIADIEIGEKNGGFYQDEQGDTYYLEADGETSIQDRWIVQGNALYYFGADGRMQKEDYEESGMRFRFAEDGHVVSILYDSAFQPKEDAALKDYPSLVRSKTLWAYLRKDKARGHFYALMYKKTTESMSHQLGGTGNPQYTGDYSMQIDGDYIYWLTLTDNPSDTEKKTNGQIYRMKPGDKVREAGPSGGAGYKVIDGTVFYYSEADQRIYQTNTFREDETALDFTTVENFTVDISDATSAVLMAEGTTPVTLESDAFKAGNFTYRLAADGSILSVREKTSVNKGGYTYSIESDEVFGESVSRVVREDAKGKREAISSEFAGTTGNLHYDFEGGFMVAEYTAKNGTSGLVRISLDGDVDELKPHGSGKRLILYALQNGEAICKDGTSEDARFISLNLNDTVPLAVATEPLAAGTSEETGEEILSETPAAVSETSAANPAPEKKQNDSNAPVLISPSEKDGDAGALVGGAPG